MMRRLTDLFVSCVDLRVSANRSCHLSPVVLCVFLVEETVKDRGYLLGVLGIGCPEADVACVFVEVT